jgi:hypothetical protein
MGRADDDQHMSPLRRFGCRFFAESEIREGSDIKQTFCSDAATLR